MAVGGFWRGLTGGLVPEPPRRWRRCWGRRGCCRGSCRARRTIFGCRTAPCCVSWPRWGHSPRRAPQDPNNPQCPKTHPRQPQQPPSQGSQYPLMFSRPAWGPHNHPEPAEGSLVSFWGGHRKSLGVPSVTLPFRGVPEGFFGVPVLTGVGGPAVCADRGAGAGEPASARGGTPGTPQRPPDLRGAPPGWSPPSPNRW